MPRKLACAVENAAWLPLLLIRLCAGVLFTSTGWEATHQLPEVSAFFEQLHIPLPNMSAAIAGYAELICGALLIVGLASRLATIPLLICMVVALATAKAPKVHGVRDLLTQVELVYVVLLITLGLLGPGRVSLDELIDRRRRERMVSARTINRT